MNVERAIEAKSDLAHSGGVEDAASEGIVAVDHRDAIGIRTLRQDFREQPQLRREVILDAAVIIEMVASQVGEEAGAKVQRIDAPLRNADRGDFGERVAQTLLVHSGKSGFDIPR